MKQAIYWFERAAAKGQSRARARLGILYLEGQGVTQDYGKAYENLSTAAKEGSPTAQYFLALMYEEGQGIRPNAAAAMTWYKKAAEGGYYQAQKGIARLEAAAKRPTLDQPPESAKAAPSKKPPPKRRTSLAEGLKETILQGRWQRNGQPVGYLPSTATTCQEKGQEIKCLSGELTRNTGFSTITYVTEATLSGFSANDEFNVSYHNNVIRAESEDPSAASGQECNLESASKLVCVKNLIATMVFENKVK